MSYRDDSGARYGPWTPEMRAQMLEGDSFKTKKKFRHFMKKAVVQRRKAGSTEVISRPRCTKSAVVNGAPVSMRCAEWAVDSSFDGNTCKCHQQMHANVKQRHLVIDFCLPSKITSLSLLKPTAVLHPSWGGLISNRNLPYSNH